MYTGLYICSFYLYQKKDKKYSYCPLNHSIFKGDKYYTSAWPLLEDFFSAHGAVQDLVEDQKLYFIQAPAHWQGETEDFRYRMVEICSGAYGIESDLYDKNKQKKIGVIGADQAGVHSFLLLIAIPKDPAADKKTQKGLLIFQSIGPYGVKTITRKVLNEYLQHTVSASFYMRNVSTSQFLYSLFENTKIKQLHLIHNRLSTDPSDAVDRAAYAQEERIFSGFLYQPLQALQSLTDKLISFGLNKEGIFEWDDGSKYNAVKVTVDLGEGKQRIVNLHQIDNLSIIETLPSQYQLPNGKVDAEKALPYLVQRAAAYLHKMDPLIS